jgi:ADP-heptose:LPS heptosyltransferase
MKIVKVMQILPRMDVGGTERGVLDLSTFFKKQQEKGIENIVVSGGGRLVKELEALGIKHYTLPVYKKTPLSLFQIPKLRRIIEEENIDIVHARSRIPGWLSFFASRNSRACYITTAHGIYRNKSFSQVMSWGKFVICPSRVVASHMKNVFNTPGEKLKIINRWVDLDNFKFIDYETKRKNLTVVAVGRISPTKGYEYLIKGFRKVVRVSPYAKLRIVGSPDKSKMRYFNSLKTIVTRFSLNYNVEFVDFRQDVESILADARLLVAPSVIEESFGRVAIEAFACGVPVIATNIGGFKEIIEDERDGILVDPKQPSQIAEGILRVFSNFDYAKAMVKRARQKVEDQYTAPQCLKQTKEVYLKTLSNLDILVVKISSLGDLILSFPTLEALRLRFPQSRIHLLSLKKYHSLLQDCPYIDNFIGLDKNYKKIKNILNISHNLRKKSFDYIIDLQNSRSSHLISCLSFPRISLGYAIRWGFLLGKKVKYIPTDQPLDSQEKVLQLLGIRFKEKKLIFWPNKTKSTLILPEAELIGINLTASVRWQSKNWSAKNIIKLIGLINKNIPAAKVVILGDTLTSKEGERIAKTQGLDLVNLSGKTSLGDLPKVLEKLKVFITPDTATLHLAQALNIPTIALFGPTDPMRHTVKNKNLYIFCEKLTCSFCYKPKCRLSHESLCLEKIAPLTVFNKVKEILS